MTHTSRRPRRLRVAAAVAALLVAGACGGDDDSASPTTTTEPPTTTTTLDEAAATEEIEAALVDFFAKLGVGDLEGASGRLQNGEAYLARMEHCRDLVTGASAEPGTVEFTDDQNATLVFAILLNGDVVLAEAGGGAVLVDGAWMISENTFLSLYDAAKDGCTGTPPPE